MKLIILLCITLTGCTILYKSNFEKTIATDIPSISNDNDVIGIGNE